MVTAISEQELEAAFREAPDFGVECLHEYFRDQVARHIKRATHGMLSADELAEAYQETLQAVLVRVRRPDFDPARPLRMVYRIARNKGIDQLRGRGHRPKTNADAHLTVMAGSLTGTETGNAWGLTSAADRREFREVVLEAVCELPERQQLIARCFVDCFEEVAAQRSYRPLAVAVGRVTGEAETVSSVKSAWHAAQAKIATELARRGFNFLKTG